MEGGSWGKKQKWKIKREKNNRGEREREDSVKIKLGSKTHNMKSCSQLGRSPRTAMVVLFTFCTLSVTYVLNFSVEVRRMKKRMLDRKTVRTKFLSHLIVSLDSKIPSVGSKFYFWKHRSSPWGPSSLAFFTVETQRDKITHRKTICFYNSPNSILFLFF